MFSLLNKRLGRGNNSPLVRKVIALLTQSSRRPRTPFREHPYLLEASWLTNQRMALGWSSNCLLFLAVISAGRARRGLVAVASTQARPPGTPRSLYQLLTTVHSTP